MKKIAFVLTGFLSVLLWSCSKNENSGAAGGTASMKVYLVDGPAAYDRVYLDIQSVQVKVSSDASEDGWQTLKLGRAGIYNLLDFKNGIDTLLGSITLPAGNVGQLRLVLGTNNSVVINGVAYPLTTPSAQQSGLKLNINATLIAGVDYKIWIDFDAARSIVQTGSGSYILKPVIRPFTVATSGGIKGFTLPVAAKGWVFAIQNAADTISSTPADAATGAFLLRGLPAATYKLGFRATAGSYRDTTISNVVVTNGAVTDVGSVTLR
ncbi:DUF4382 domain-containing protein [Sediminibacterium soli]|uniref:DUF4382 domain-containing protein n=1 Tax=Sediminibacterium soli TaxID=2698829 RepID=UPI001379CD74|nr:DUF4382 domain-containing protein [Sediminibacterium soli]NCI47011.1 DUF4382 domain-containing protein [Sediminibacterium soli]